MKKLVVLCLMAVCAALCHAQGNVKGDIIDTSTGEALPFVNVAVYNRTTGEFVKGAVSDAEGAFNVTGLPYGQYTLKLSYIGYTTVTGEFALTERRRHANMKTMSMSEDSQTLEEVTVTAQRPSMRLEVDRKSFDVSQDISNAGGAASDVLENIPSVEVDTDGNISLRGNTSVEVWINGKASGLTSDNRAEILQQIPSESIDRIEVIDNPSAKFSAEGSAGIINIVLKKNRTAGYYGSAQAGGNTNGTLRSLESVTLPDTLRSIGQYFFSGSAVAEIALPDGLETIGNYAFSGCSSLSSISLPQSLTDIGIEAFKGTAIANAEIPSKITYLKNGLFENCKALKSAVLPEKLEKIGDKVFKGAEKLAAVNMPSGVTDIGAEAFYGCKALTGFVDSDEVVRFYLPEGITAISDGCFAHCPLKTSFTIPDQILSIGDAAFKSTYLTELTISESLKSIGAEAFRNSKLRDLTIPESLLSLGEDAFAGSELNSVTVPVKFIYNMFFWLEHAAILKSLTVTGTGTIGHDPDGVAVSAPLDEYDYIETVVIADTVTGIGEAAFAGLSKLKTVTIGDGVKTIGDNAFGLDGKGCYMLETVNIGSGVKSIGKCIFAGWHTEQHATGKLTVKYAGGQLYWDRNVSKPSNWYFDVSATKLVMNYNVNF